MSALNYPLQQSSSLQTDYVELPAALPDDSPFTLRLCSRAAFFLAFHSARKLAIRVDNT
jgi:hypothetical protein